MPLTKQKWQNGRQQTNAVGEKSEVNKPYTEIQYLWSNSSSAYKKITNKKPKSRWEPLPVDTQPSVAGDIEPK